MCLVITIIIHLNRFIQRPERSTLPGGCPHLRVSARTLRTPPRGDPSLPVPAKEEEPGALATLCLLRDWTPWPWGGPWAPGSAAGAAPKQFGFAGEPWLVQLLSPPQRPPSLASLRRHWDQCWDRHASEGSWYSFLGPVMWALGREIQCAGEEGDWPAVREEGRQGWVLWASGLTPGLVLYP